MTTQIEALEAALIKNNVKVKAWRGSRIYFNGFGRDIAYLEFDFPSDVAGDDLLSGTTLKVFSNCESQPAKWRINRAKQIKHSIMNILFDSGLIPEQHKPCENWEDVIL